MALQNPNATCSMVVQATPKGVVVLLVEMDLFLGSSDISSRTTVHLCPSLATICNSELGPSFSSCLCELHEVCPTQILAQVEAQPLEYPKVYIHPILDKTGVIDSQALYR